VVNILVAYDSYSGNTEKMARAVAVLGETMTITTTLSLSLLTMMLNYGMLVFGVPDYVAQGVTLHYGAVSIGAPDENELKACRLLGERLVEMTHMVKRGRPD